MPRCAHDSWFYASIDLCDAHRSRPQQSVGILPVEDLPLAARPWFCILSLFAAWGNSTVMSAAFQHMVTLLSFVLALAASHQLLTIVDAVRAGPRVKPSWVHGLWMLNGFLQVITWWVGIWDFHNVADWSVVAVLFNLAAVVCVFLAIAFCCPRIPESGTVDLWEFHQAQRKKYVGFTIGAAVPGIAEAIYFGDIQNVPGQNLQAAIIAVNVLVALVAFFVPGPVVQRLAAIAIVAGSVLFLLVGDPMLRSS